MSSGESKTGKLWDVMGGGYFGAAQPTQLPMFTNLNSRLACLVRLSHGMKAQVPNSNAAAY